MLLTLVLSNVKAPPQCCIILNVYVYVSRAFVIARLYKTGQSRSALLSPPPYYLVVGIVKLVFLSQVGSVSCIP